ncbi:Golgi-associated plant pathogenesis-related protein 1 [Hydra vulgaris]|uniref:Golgi-associated plant pathogenesis-related protein 1 n=1 Tax=Hydra vulgaris TaxID=6087 RepID=A0ABM4DG44_HYDVU
MMLGIKIVLRLLLVYLAFLHCITADLECKEDIFKEAKDNVDCSYFTNICIKKCQSYQGYTTKCAFATDSFGKKMYNKNGCSCICKGNSNSVITPIGHTLPPVQTVSPVQTAASLNAFRNTILVNHNNYRKLHGVPYLKLNQELNFYAQQRAEMWAQTGMLMKNPFGPGENPYWAYNTAPPNGEDAVNLWYNEIKDWNFKANPETQASPKTEHFAQVIWKSTSELGVGRAYNLNTVYVVCSYYYGGNIFGQYGNNVMPRLA